VSRRLAYDQFVPGTRFGHTHSNCNRCHHFDTGVKAGAGAKSIFGQMIEKE
jgi:hypothetical protein